jgi:hypothetical protein
MKKLLTSTLSLITMTSGAAIAHTGHMTNESMHGLLHVEHIIALAAIVLAAYLLGTTKNR